MATRKQKSVGEVVHEAVEASEAEAVAGDLVDALSALPSEAQLYVQRRNEETKAWDHCTKYGIDEFATEKVQGRFGGGTYRVLARFANADGKFRIGLQRGFSIVGPPKWTGAVQDGPPPMNGTGNGTGGGTASGSIIDMGMLTLIKGMQDNSAMTLQMVKDHASMQLELMRARPQVNIAEMLTGAAGLLTALGLGGANRKDPMELATQLATLMRPPEGAAPASSYGEIFEILQAGMKLGRGGTLGEEADPTTSLLGKGLDALVAIAQRAPHQPVHPQPPAAVIASPAQDAHVTDTAPAPVLRPWLEAIYPLRAQLVAGSRLLNPTAAADEVTARLDKELLTDLLDDFESGTPEEWADRTGPVLGFPPARREWLIDTGVAIYEAATEEVPDDATQDAPADALHLDALGTISPVQVREKKRT